MQLAALGLVDRAFFELEPLRTDGSRAGRRPSAADGSTQDRRTLLTGASLTKAIVMGLTPPGIALARSLGRAGVEVLGISSDEDPAAAHSRLFRFRRGPSNQDVTGSLEFYLELARELGEPAVLLPTGDLNVLFISTHRSQLDPHFRYLLPSEEQIGRITSKREFPQLAEELGLPLPRTLVPTSAEDLAREAPTLRFPCVIKPEFTHLWRSQAAREAQLRSTKAIPVADLDELLTRYDELARVDDRLLVQEQIIGPDENHVDYAALVDTDGRFLGQFAGRKLRTHPPHFGLGCYVESIALDEVGELGRSILERLGYRGPAWVQLKRDDRDGRYYLYEINTRFGIWVGLPIAAGVDFGYAYYKAALGEQHDAGESYDIGKRWLNLADDRKSLGTYLADGTWSRSRWAMSLLRASAWSLLALDDPSPSLVSLRRGIRHGLRE